jgi:hypothetical protein
MKIECKKQAGEVDDDDGWPSELRSSSLKSFQPTVDSHDFEAKRISFTLFFQSSDFSEPTQKLKGCGERLVVFVQQQSRSYQYPELRGAGYHGQRIM